MATTTATTSKRQLAKAIKSANRLHIDIYLLAREERLNKATSQREKDIQQLLHETSKIVVSLELMNR